MLLLFSSLVYAADSPDALPLEFLLGSGIVLGFVLAYCLIACYATYRYHQILMSIPERHHQISPFVVWLNLVPICCFNNIIAGIIAISLCSSFESYFRSIDDSSQGSCGKELAVAYMILQLLASIPYIGLLFFLIMPVFWIFLIRRFQDLSGILAVTRIVESD